MSVIFNVLEKKAVVPEIREDKRETLLSVKLSIAFAFFISFAAVVFSIYLLQSFNTEKKERETFDVGYAQSQEKLQMLEYETKQYQSDLTKIKGEVADLGKVTGKADKKIEELQSEMSSVHQELAGVANATREIKESLQKANEAVAPAVVPIEPGN